MKRVLLKNLFIYHTFYLRGWGVWVLGLWDPRSGQSRSGRSQHPGSGHEIAFEDLTPSVMNRVVSTILEVLLSIMGSLSSKWLPDSKTPVGPGGWFYNNYHWF